MRRALLTFIFAFSAPALAHGQAVAAAQPAADRPSLREQLIPANSAPIFTNAGVAEKKSDNAAISQPAVSRRSGVGYMIAGAALFVAGLLVDGDAGTFLAVAGAGIGAYGLYVHFR